MAFVQTWKAPEDKVIVEVRPEANQTPTGIMLPDQMRTVLKRGKVLAVGPDAKGVSVGYEVRFLSGKEIEVGQAGTASIVSLSSGYVMAGLKESFE